MNRTILSVIELDRGFIVEAQLGTDPTSGMHRTFEAAAPTLQDALALGVQAILGLDETLTSPTHKGDNTQARGDKVTQGLQTSAPTPPQGGDADQGDEDDNEPVAYGVAPETQFTQDVPLANQLTNLNTLNECFAAGKTKSGHPFAEAEWAAGLERYCPNIDPAHAEIIRAQFMGQRREGAGWE